MVGNDDSGPEDALDDLDLECEQAKRLSDPAKSPPYYEHKAL